MHYGKVEHTFKQNGLIVTYNSFRDATVVPSSITLRMYVCIYMYVYTFVHTKNLLNHNIIRTYVHMYSPLTIFDWRVIQGVKLIAPKQYEETIVHTSIGVWNYKKTIHKYITYI